MLAELVDRLGAAVRSLNREQSLTAWVDALVEAVRDLTEVPPYDDWQVNEARRQLTDALVSAGDRADGVMLGLSDVRALLTQRLRGRPTRANFRTGHLTICTLVPMRSVPHRVVCLLGLDDGVFPRGTHVDGDDVLTRTPRVGERDPRAEDRQLFLDAVLAAGERLVVLYTGADERTGAERPPAVPLGELLDVVGHMGSSDVVVHHPLQPFDARNFVGDELGEPGPFSFDHASYDGSKALLQPRTVQGPFLARPLPDVDASEVVELDALVRFLEHPVRGFLRQRLGLTAIDEGEEADDAIPVEAKGLADWKVGDRLLRAGLAGATRDDAVRAERLRGELPPVRWAQPWSTRSPGGSRSWSTRPRVCAPVLRRPSTSRSTSRRGCGWPARCPACTGSGSSASSTPGSARSTASAPGSTSSRSWPRSRAVTGAPRRSGAAATTR